MWENAYRARVQAGRSENPRDVAIAAHAARYAQLEAHREAAKQLDALYSSALNLGFARKVKAIQFARDEITDALIDLEREHAENPLPPIPDPPKTTAALDLMWRAYRLILQILSLPHMQEPKFPRFISSPALYSRDMAKIKRLDTITARLADRLRKAIREEGIDPSTVKTPYDH